MNQQHQESGQPTSTNAPTGLGSARSPETPRSTEVDSAFSNYVTAWTENRVLERTGKHQNIIEDLKKLSELMPDKLLELLPDSSLRPVLAAAVIYELRDAGVNPEEADASTLIEQSPTLSLLHYKYKPAYIQDVLQRLDGFQPVEGAGLTAVDKLDQIVQEQGGTNSTLRNLLIADRLNQTVFKGTPLQAKIALANYTWREQNSKVSLYDLPELPEGCADNTYVRFVIAVTKDSQPLTYFDYGQNEGKERYGTMATGEGIGNIVGTPPPQEFFDPSIDGDVLAALRAVRDSQRHPGEQEAVRRIGLHKAMIRSLFDFIDTPQGENFPAVITSVDDLTDTQLESVLQCCNYFEQMTQGSEELIGNQEMRLGTGMVFTVLKGMHARVESTQASTRTVTAAEDAMKALGFEVDVPNLTARDKGESAISEGVTLTTHAVDVVLRRDKDNESEAQELAKHGDTIPTRISLGGNEHHPTQTLGEIRALMDLFGCETHTIEELQERVRKTKPVFTFISRTDQKRADKALIQFILDRLPEATVEVYVPEEKDLPEIEIPEGANYEQNVHEDLQNQDELRRITKGTTLLYTSNAEATSKVEEKGKGDGKREAPHYISAEVMEENGFHIMHPLPASGELEDSIFLHKQSLIPNQMKNKIYIIASLVAHQLLSKRKRAENAASSPEES